MSEESPSEENPSVEDRIAYLEEQNEGMKRVGLLLVILVLVMGGTMIYQSSSLSSALSTDGLIITGDGKPKAALTDMHGHLGLVFYNHNGTLPVAQYESIPYLDGLVIYDRSGKPRILTGLDEHDNPVLAVVGADGKTLFNAVPPAAPAEKGSETAAPQATPTPAVTATPTR